MQKLIGGLKETLCIGTEEHCRTKYAEFKTSFRGGNLVLMEPGNGFPVEQCMRPAYRPEVTTLDGADESSPPIIRVLPPDLEKVKAYLDPEALTSAGLTADAPPTTPNAEEKPLRVERLPHAAQAERIAQEIADGRAAFGVTADWMRDLNVVDNAIRNLELALPILRIHRQALIAKIADNQSADGTQRLLARALESLRAIAE